MATHIRFFKVRKQEFSLNQRDNGLLQVTSIHPYDNTEYHSASQVSKSTWGVYRAGRLVSTLRMPKGMELTPEEVATCLLQADQDANLKPRTAIW